MMEAHVTIEPVEGDRLDLFKRVCARYRFKVAELLMVKDRKATEERSNRDSFATGHSANYLDMMTRLLTLVGDLKQEGFQVFRYKIEAVLLDVRL